MSISPLNLQSHLSQLGVAEHSMNKALNKHYTKCITYYLNKHRKLRLSDTPTGLLTEACTTLTSPKYSVRSLLDLFWLNASGLDVLWRIFVNLSESIHADYHFEKNNQLTIFPRKIIICQIIIFTHVFGHLNFLSTNR